MLKLPLRRSAEDEPWTWLKEAPEPLATFVSPSCATASFGNVRRVDTRTIHDAVTSGDAEAVAAALYDHLRELGIDYDEPGYSADGPHSQHVRSPAEIAERGRATCLDLSLLFSALALDLNLRPIVVLLEGHALVAISRPEGYELEITRDTTIESMLGWIEDGDLIPVETTGLARGDGVDYGFDEAVRIGRQRIEDGRFESAIDPLRLHRDRGYRPRSCGRSRLSWAVPAAAAGSAMVVVGVMAGLQFTGDEPTTFGDETTGVVLLPSIEGPEDGPVAATAMTALFDDALRDDAAADDGPLGGAALADNVDGRALVDGSLDARQQAALQLATTTNASVVISPRLTLTNNRASVEFEAWLGNVDGAEELAGQELRFLFCGPPAGVTGNFSTVNDDSIALFSELADESGDQLGRVGDLLEAVADQRRFRYPAALDGLSGILDDYANGACSTAPGLALLYHMRGNIHVDLGEYDDARDDYDEALDLDGGFVRSELGLAEADLVEAVHRGCPGTGINVINQAIDRYVALDTGADESGTLPIKADVGLGRARACAARAVSQLGRDPQPSLRSAADTLDRALTSYESAIASEPDSRQLLVETAAIGYMERARVRQWLIDVGGSDMTEDDVLRDYREAAGTSERHWVLAEAQYNIAETCGRLGDTGCRQDAQAAGCDHVADARAALGDAELVASDDVERLAALLDCDT